jgi:predicted DNA-binding protein (MmcQ/YjbR family)
MNVDAIRDYCLAFPEAAENLQWGDDLCFKIGGKIFVTLALSAIPQKVCFKCTPDVFAELIERPDIRPAPYVGRYQWVILDRLDALPETELKDLIRRSYEMVRANAPHKAGKTRNAPGKKRTPPTGRKFRKEGTRPQ